MSRAQTPAANRARVATPGEHGGNPYSLGETSQTKILPKDVVDKAVDRLSRPHTPAVTLEPLTPSKKLHGDQLKASVNRLYEQTLETKKANHDSLTRKFLVDRRPQKTLSQDESDGFIQRLYYGGVKSHNDKLLLLKKKLWLNYERKRDDQAGEKIKHCVEHLYVEEKSRHQKRMDELYKKYVESTGPKVVKRSGADIEEIVNRFAVKK